MSVCPCFHWYLIRITPTLNTAAEKLSAWSRTDVNQPETLLTNTSNFDSKPCLYKLELEIRFINHRKDFFLKKCARAQFWQKKRHNLNISKDFQTSITLNTPNIFNVHLQNVSDKQITSTYVSSYLLHHLSIWLFWFELFVVLFPSLSKSEHLTSKQSEKRKNIYLYLYFWFRGP